jgi:hypothetical protein
LRARRTRIDQRSRANCGQQAEPISHRALHRAPHSPEAEPTRPVATGNVRIGSSFRVGSGLTSGHRQPPVRVGYGQVRTPVIASLSEPRGAMMRFLR